MPFYEYQCHLCGHHLEAFQSISDAPLTLCPQCHGEGLNKLISNTNFQLKGTGWYKTDYEKKQKSATTNKENEGKTATEPTADAKATKKTETKTDGTAGSSTSGAT